MGLSSFQVQDQQMLAGNFDWQFWLAMLAGRVKSQVSIVSQVRIEVRIGEYLIIII